MQQAFAEGPSLWGFGSRGWRGGAATLDSSCGIVPAVVFHQGFKLRKERCHHHGQLHHFEGFCSPLLRDYSLGALICVYRSMLIGNSLIEIQVLALPDRETQSQASEQI